MTDIISENNENKDIVYDAFKAYLKWYNGRKTKYYNAFKFIPEIGELNIKDIGLSDIKYIINEEIYKPKIIDNKNYCLTPIFKNLEDFNDHYTINYNYIEQQLRRSLTMQEKNDIKKDINNHEIKIYDSLNNSLDINKLWCCDIFIETGGIRFKNYKGCLKFSIVKHDDNLHIALGTLNKTTYNTIINMIYEIEFCTLDINRLDYVELHNGVEFYGEYEIESMVSNSIIDSDSIIKFNFKFKNENHHIAFKNYDKHCFKTICLKINFSKNRNWAPIFSDSQIKQNYEFDNIIITAKQMNVNKITYNNLYKYLLNSNILRLIGVKKKDFMIFNLENLYNNVYEIVFKNINILS